MKQTKKENLKMKLLVWVINSDSRIYNVIRVVISFIDGIKIKRAIKKGIPFVLIYQQGRVASTSVYESIKSIKLPYPLYHVHTLSEQVAQKQIDQLKLEGGKIHRNLFVGKQLSRALKNKKLVEQSEPWKIISIFRDPIEIMLSLYFLGIEDGANIFLNKSGELDKNLALKFYENKFIKDDPSGWGVCHWFNNVFLDELGVDVFLSPFDQEKGFTVIKNQQFDILLIRYEDIQSAYKYGVAELFNIEPNSLNLQYANLHSNKKHSEIHKYVKQNLKLTREFCDKAYSTKLIKHFYSPEQIETLIKKWSY